MQFLNNMAEENSEKSFSHKATDSNFKARVDSVFSALGALEKKHEATVSEQDPFEEPAEAYGTKDRENDSSSRPTHRPNKRKPARVPDHVLHPDKWRKYSLEEDGTEQCAVKGDALNRSIALDFLKELAARKLEKKTGLDKGEDTVSDQSDAHMFKKPDDFPQTTTSERLPTELEEDTPIDSLLCPSTSTVNRMATYEVGVKVKKTTEKKRLDVEPNKSNELSLSHLDQSDASIEDSIETITTASEPEEQDRIVEKSVNSSNTKTLFKGGRKNRAGVRKRGEDSDPE